MNDIVQPLTYLFVPGNRPERFAKAFAAGADRVILDLEDAVAPTEKAAARTAIAGWMATAGEERDKALIRINDSATEWHAADVALVSNIAVPCVMLPKCESAGQVAALRAALPDSTGVLPLIETARGMLMLGEIAHAAGVVRLAFGSIDYMADLDLPPDSLALVYAASQIAIASRAAGLASPIAGVTPDLDSARVSADMAQARSLGFGAKMCIHPAQVSAVRAALAPSVQELAWAGRVLQAWGDGAAGALQVDGKMVDRPVVLKARRIVSQARLTQ